MSGCDLSTGSALAAGWGIRSGAAVEGPASDRAVGAAVGPCRCGTKAPARLSGATTLRNRHSPAVFVFSAIPDGKPSPLFLELLQVCFFRNSERKTVAAFRGMAQR